MTNIRGTGELSDLLSDFETEVTGSITAELRRIGRTVRMDELEYIPFNDDVESYVDAIRLDEKGEVILDTSFADKNEKYLTSFISDSEIGHWELIGLLGMLQNIQA